MEQLEERLRKLEIEHTEWRAVFSPMLEDVKSIRQTLENIKSEAIKVDRISRLEDAVRSAHKRLDEKERFFFEHEVCQKNRVIESQHFATLRDDMRDVKQALKQLQAAGATTSNWWQARLTRLIDWAAPMVLMLALTIGYSHYESKKNPPISQAELKSLQQTVNAWAKERATTPELNEVKN